MEKMIKNTILAIFIVIFIVLSVFILITDSGNNGSAKKLTSNDAEKFVSYYQSQIFNYLIILLTYITILASLVFVGSINNTFMHWSDRRKLLLYIILLFPLIFLSIPIQVSEVARSGAINDAGLQGNVTALESRSILYGLLSEHGLAISSIIAGSLFLFVIWLAIFGPCDQEHPE